MDLKEINSTNSNRHPWELSRADFIMNEIIKIRPRRVIDVGSGDGYLGKLIENRLGIEVHYIDVNFTQDQLKLPRHYLRIEDLRAEANDLLLLADVLEHVEMPELFLKNLCSHTMSGNGILITVPAFQNLYSNHDNFLGHYRRYDKKLLLEHTQTSIHPFRLRYFFFLPYLIRSLQVLIGTTVKTSAVSEWKYGPRNLVTILSKWVLKLDLMFSFLPGLSLLCVGRIK